MQLRTNPLMPMGAVCLLLSSCGGGGAGGGSPVQSPPPPPVSVAVAPTNAAVVLGNTQQFSATVSGSTNSSVSWSVNGAPGGNAAVGTIAATGLYTAPQNLPTPSSVTITATSQADPSRAASAAVGVVSDLVVTIAPDPASVELGATHVFTANVASAGNPNRTVAWSVNGVPGGDATLGTITSAGVYTAPANLPAPAALTLTATSTADSSKADSASLNVTSTFALSIAGPSALDTGATASFAATLIPVPGSNPNPAILWSVNSIPNGDATVGQICTPGVVACTAPGTPAATVEYRAPLLAPAGGVVAISAVSAADGAKQATTMVTINSVINVRISPATGVSVALDGSVQFTATVSGTADQRVEWAVNGMPGGDQLTIGAITNSANLLGPATYFAPSQLLGGSNIVTVTATSQFDTSVSASVSVQLFSNVVIAVATGAGASTSLRAVSRTETLCVALASALNTGIVWTVNGILNGNTSVGTIVPLASPVCPPLGPAGALISAFTYTAPSTVPVPADVVATAASVADPSRSESVTITVLPNPVVTISPPSLTLQTDSIAQFSAQVAGTPVPGVAWLVNGVANGDTTSGLICVVASNPCQAPAPAFVAAVEYRAPATVPGNPAVTITAAGADGGSATAAVNIVPPAGPSAPAITGMLPASVTAGVASPFLLKVLGANFAPGSGSSASVILFGTPPVAKTTSCLAPASGPRECTAIVDSAEVAAAGSISVQVQNPDLALSNAVALVVAAESSSEEVIPLTSATPVASAKDIVVVEPLVAGSGAQTLNVAFLGIVSAATSSCTGQSSPVAIPRPASGSVTVEICLGGSGLLATQQYSISGTDITLGTPVAVSLGIVQVRLPLTIPSTAQLGARTIFVQNGNKEKTAATGAVEIR